jgi:16S rRNA (cytosine1402-N4)-methyltransferase
MSVHTPVLLQEVIEYLNLASGLPPQAGKKVIDATLDGGGHTREIRKQFPDVEVLGIEWDPVEAEEFKQNNPELAEQIIVVNESYTKLRQIVEEHDFRPDGILFDLGLSSWHYEASGRGFSFKRDEVLDMRFNPQSNQLTAAQIVNEYDKEELERILAFYGEEQFAPQITEAIVTARKAKAIMTTNDLVAVIRSAVPTWYTKRKIHCATKTFQALRVVVNGELENVKEGIAAAVDVLSPGGRLLVISFQGMEDKIVREFFKEQAKVGIIKWVTRHTVKPTWKEQEANPRSRSAKLKIVEKL